MLLRGESAATVQIFASYSSNTFVTQATYSLYDSKCRSCNEGGLASQPVIIKISYIYYDYKENVF